MGERGGNLEDKERQEITISSSLEEEGKGNMLLPRMVLRVLLVEADDSTRQIIAALLRKCSYRVAAVADGLEAWETLKGRPHNVDLILTEVELPSISGYALLTLIMEHDICKHIPVIMMSSNDSISLVLNCMSKGAADYLIKPIRKNELRNLWQHVWRRQINESRNIPEREKVSREEVEVASDDNGANNHSSYNLTAKRRNKHCLVICSDSQSSCGTPYLRAETAGKLNVHRRLQVKLENASSMCKSRKHEKCAKMVGKTAMPISGSGVASYGAHMMDVMGEQEDNACAELMVEDTERLPNIHGESQCQTCAFSESSCGAIDVNGKFDGFLADLDGDFHNQNGTKKVDISSKLELSLSMGPSCTKDEQTEQHTFHLSKGSAFSRYDHNKMVEPPFPIPASNSALIKEGANSFHQQSVNQFPVFCNTVGHNPAPTKDQGNTSKLNLGQYGQPEEAFPSGHVGFFPIHAASFDNVYSSYGYIFPLIYFMQLGFPSFWSTKSCHEGSALPSSSSIRSTSEVCNAGQTFDYPNEKSVLQSADAALQRVDEHLGMTSEIRHSSAVLDFSNDVTNKLSNNVAESIVSASQDNHLPAAAIARPTESVNDNGLLHHDGLQGIGSQFTSQRRAALIKFRLKRKDRCYVKKIWYRSRKKTCRAAPSGERSVCSSRGK